MSEHAAPAAANGATTSAPAAPAAPAASAQWGRMCLAGAAAGALWLAVGGAAQALRWFANLDTLTAPVVPETMPGILWMWPAAWGYLAALLGALAVAAITVAILALSARGMRANGGTTRPGRGRTWLAVILAATLVGIATDIARLLGFGPIPGVGEGLRGRLMLTGLGDFAALGAYFGVLYGWICALAGPRRAARPAAGPTTAGPTAIAGFDPDHAGAPKPRASQRRSPSLLAAVATVVAAVALVAGYAGASTQGARVHHEVSQGEARAAEEAAAIEAGTPRTGAVPDPSAEGEPVPERATTAVERDPAWCGRDDLTLMLGLSDEELENGDRGNPELEQGTHDAALGHRAMPLRAVNISDEPCAFEGYPDLAFSDQNGHLLDVLVTLGDSFMAQDAGPSTVMLQPGETAIARLGWNANSTQGALVAVGVHAAPLAGDTRDVWQLPTALDVTAGSELAVTAWEFEPLPAP